MPELAVHSEVIEGYGRVTGMLLDPMYGVPAGCPRKMVASRKRLRLENACDTTNRHFEDVEKTFKAEAKFMNPKQRGVSKDLDWFQTAIDFDAAEAVAKEAKETTRKETTKTTPAAKAESKRKRRKVDSADDCGGSTLALAMAAEALFDAAVVDEDYSPVRFGVVGTRFQVCIF